MVHRFHTNSNHPHPPLFFVCQYCFYVVLLLTTGVFSSPRQPWPGIAENRRSRNHPSFSDFKIKSGEGGNPRSQCSSSAESTFLLFVYAEFPPVQPFPCAGARPLSLQGFCWLSTDWQNCGIVYA